jgi:O-antigen ligase
MAAKSTSLIKSRRVSRHTPSVGHQRNGGPHIRATQRSRRSWLLILTVVALPFSYVPHELIPSGPSVSIVVLALTLASGAYYGILGQRVGPIEALVVVFAVYCSLRIGVLGPLQTRDATVDVTNLVGSVGALISGLVLYLLARKDELREIVLVGLRLMVGLLLAIELYQLVAGLPRLFALGYTDGFYYYTEGNDYRPFATFLSPTVFGGFLAVAGTALVLATRGREAFLWFAVVSMGLIATQTRAAQIAFAVAMLVGWVGSSALSRRRIVQAGIPLVFVLVIVVLLEPGLITRQFERLTTLTDAGYTSNSARIQLWTGALRASLESPVIGYPSGSFVEVLRPIIGGDALYGHAHSNYLQVLFLYGYLGLALFLSILVVAFFAIVGTVGRAPDIARRYAVAGLGAWTAFAVDSMFETTWTSLSVASTFFLLLGLGMAPVRREDGKALDLSVSRGHGAAGEAHLHELTTGPSLHTPSSWSYVSAEAPKIVLPSKGGT